MCGCADVQISKLADVKIRRIIRLNDLKFALNMFSGWQLTAGCRLLK